MEPCTQVRFGESNGMDAALRPFVAARGERAERDALDRLLREHAEPVICGILRRRWRGAETAETPDGEMASEAWSETMHQTIAWLRSCKQSPRPIAVTDFRAYVAVTAYRACDHALRRRYPVRDSLKCRLRALIAREPGFALWEDGGRGTVCGLAAWRGRDRSAAASARLRTGRGPVTGADKEVAVLLRRAGGPVGLDDLVDAVTDRAGIRDSPASAKGADESGAAWERLADPGQDVAARAEQRAYLRALWREVGRLPVRQRAALILNLRDARGRGVLALLPLAGIASVGQIADALEMTSGALAALWDELPLEDDALARMWGVSRQQVINLRKAARQCLSRRMQPME